MKLRVYRNEDGEIEGLVEEFARHDDTANVRHVGLRDAKGAAIEVTEFRGEAIAHRDWHDPSDPWTDIGGEA